MSQELRDAVIHNAVETRRARDVKIMQGVNQAHREAFQSKWPGQSEHILRLVSERLLLCLGKPPGTELTQPGTWLASPEEIAFLSSSLYYIHLIYQDLHNEKTTVSETPSVPTSSL
jgi:hypothetical protein